MLNGPNYDTAAEDARRGPAKAGKALVTVLVVAGALLGARYVMNGPASGLSANLLENTPGVRTDGRPVVVLFTADWCPPCRTLKARVLSNDAVAARLKKSFQFVKVDLTTRERAESDLTSRYGVQSIPTLIMLDAKGGEVARYNGPTEPVHFIRWLDAHAR